MWILFTPDEDWKMAPTVRERDQSSTSLQVCAVDAAGVLPVAVADAGGAGWSK